ncbi:UNVERIFIED_CONTAM: Homeobox-leucine zipper protein HAT14 [Sesamum angustifolium]|uniref:Homeobox-leucine zipper protein HAT14 n=1 Tax=Sesamum angustifolium TaxID=2727405 RepID=A0AAW2MSD0_9LAMI
MELGLSLGDAGHSDTPKQAFSFLDKSQAADKIFGRDLGFCMACSGDGGKNNGRCTETGADQNRTPVQLDLLPFPAVDDTTQPSSNKLFPLYSWLTQNLVVGEPAGKGRPEVTHEEAAAEVSCDPNSTVCLSNQMDFSDQNGGINIPAARKKTKAHQTTTAFLEENFKEHHTLSHKQKLGIAKQLKLGPRQVEVWFQNRRARKKVKQTEVDCEYLKRCCEKLSEDNKRLQKQVQELRALTLNNTASTLPPLYNNMVQYPPPTTTLLLSICPSCTAATTTTPHQPYY